MNNESPVYLLKTVKPDGSAYAIEANGFRYPLEVGAAVEAPDWNDAAQCGGGLHGLRNGAGNANRLTDSPDSVWLVLRSTGTVVDLDGKIKTESAIVEHVGDKRSATDWLWDRTREAAIVYRTATAGYGGTATAGYGGTATVGNGGIATVGNGGIATVGDGGTATAGYRGTATAGDWGTIVIRQWDSAARRYRLIVGYIGENGLKPNTPYRLDSIGNFVEITPKKETT